MDADQYRSGTPPKLSKTENVSVLKMDAQFSTDRKTVQNLNKEFEGKLDVSSFLRINSNQVAADTLKEAIKLKNRADHFKNSGPVFESNETYLQAGLKFLHGASLLKDCSFQSDQQCEISQIRNYDTAAKLFKSCAHEYESRQDMSSAALAYKCMEVAYVRLVFCKLYSADRVLDELLLAAQGKSPSFASDVDNLNNQVAMDKVCLSRGTTALLFGNLVICGRTCLDWIRFIDSSQDFVLAYKACKKCQSTFAAASAILEEAKARNVDAIAAIKSAIDFGVKDEDEDVEEFVSLVQIATKAINPAGLGAARDQLDPCV